MEKDKKIKKNYDSPIVEVIKFSMEDSIATSAGTQGVSLWEQMWSGQ